MSQTERFFNQNEHVLRDLPEPEFQGAPEASPQEGHANQKVSMDVLSLRTCLSTALRGEKSNGYTLFVQNKVDGSVSKYRSLVIYEGFPPYLHTYF